MTSAADSTRTPTPRKRGLLRAIFSDTWVRHGIGGTVSAIAWGVVFSLYPWENDPHWAGPAWVGAVAGAVLYMVCAAWYSLGMFDDVLPGLRARWGAIRARADEDV